MTMQEQSCLCLRNMAHRQFTAATSVIPCGGNTEDNRFLGFLFTEQWIDVGILFFSVFS